jgi:hypothetical protein
VASVGDVPSRRTLGSYVDAFAPMPEWSRLPWWPPDVFAVASLVLDHTESYRFVIAPPPGHRWPPAPTWNADVAEAAERWTAPGAAGHGAPPPLVRRAWDVVTAGRTCLLSEVRCGAAWDVCEALLTLLAVADEAAAGLGTGDPETWGPFEQQARALLEEQGSLAHLAPARVRIVPKTHSAARGITIRSLSRYLALCYEAVDVRWRRVLPSARAERQEGRYRALLVPWPLTVHAGDFRPVAPPLGNMDTTVFGFFEFAPSRPFDVDHVERLLRAVPDLETPVDAVVLPEAALQPADVTNLEPVLAAHDVSFLVAGVREPGTARVLGRNYVHVGVRTADGWQRHAQDKHHRWCVDGNQVRQYHLSRALDPRRLWWEAIDIPERSLHVLDVGGGTTFVPLVCEDLARMDEVADVVRRIGPALVVALLLDGPQLVGRWPCRYAAVLGDEPGSAVLTLTALGMAARSRPAGLPPSRVVAMWNDDAGGLHEIALAPGAGGVLVTVAAGLETVWTADGRRHTGVPRLSLAGVRQVRPVAAAAPEHRGWHSG